MKALTDWLQDYLIETITRHTKSVLKPLVDYLRRLSIGLLILWVSAVAWGVSLVFLLLTLFFSLSPYHLLTLPALWTALVCVLVGIILVAIGLRLIRRPR